MKAAAGLSGVFTLSLNLYSPSPSTKSPYNFTLSALRSNRQHESRFAKYCQVGFFFSVLWTENKLLLKFSIYQTSDKTIEIHFPLSCTSTCKSPHPFTSIS